MRSLLPAARIAAPLLALTLAACQDPTGVGLGLIDDDTSLPTTEAVVATASSIQTAPTTTAGFALSGTPIQTRVLIGSVEDPIYGDATARAYLDANLPTAGRPENFQDSTITAVALQLAFDLYTTVDGDTTGYVYGDPTAALPIEIREVTSGWAPTDLAVDATLATGDLIASGTIQPTDTTFTLNVDPAWVSANLTKIRSEDFVTAFEGFEVRVPEGTVPGVVRGFSALRSRLLVATTADTLQFPINEVLTSLEQGDGETADGLAVLRAGRGTGLLLDFDFAPIGATALARADLRLTAERAQTGGTAFVRPLSREARLVGLKDGESVVDLSLLTVSADGEAVTNRGAALTAAIQDILIGALNVDAYRVVLPSNPVSLDVLPVVVDADTDRTLPRFTLTLVGSSSGL